LEKQRKKREEMQNNASYPVCKYEMLGFLSIRFPYNCKENCGDSILENQLYKNISLDKIL